MIAKLTYNLSDFIPGSGRQDLLSCTISWDVDRSIFLLNRLHGFTEVGASR